MTKPGEDLQKIKRLMDESRVKEKKKRQMEQVSKEFKMREKIRQEQMEYEKKKIKLMGEDPNIRSWRLKEIRGEIRTGSLQTHQRSSDGAQTTEATNHLI